MERSISGGSFLIGLPLLLVVGKKGDFKGWIPLTDREVDGAKVINGGDSADPAFPRHCLYMSSPDFRAGDFSPFAKIAQVCPHRETRAFIPSKDTCFKEL